VTIDGSLAKQPIGGRGWYVSREGLTFAVIQGPERFLMGSPEQEKDHRKDETLHRRRISRRFAIATKPVTVGQFEKFREDTNLPKDHQTWNYAPYKNCPQPRVTWFEAAAYCNWLSQREGISEEQWCYQPKNGHYAPGMTVAPNYLSLSGYRLPTEAEWEYSCRAGSSASRYFGDSDELLTLYAWFNKNANDRTQLVGSLKPNDFGLFDMLGNVEEWCQDRFRDYPSIGLGEPIEDVEDQLDVLEGINADERVRRGGSFIIFAGLVRSADRDSDSPDDRRNYVGFRPAKTCT
jgi:formylglycine-generating enzyme required for sulfatase activity